LFSNISHKSLIESQFFILQIYLFHERVNIYSSFIIIYYFGKHEDFCFMRINLFILNVVLFKICLILRWFLSKIESNFDRFFDYSSCIVTMILTEKFKILIRNFFSCKLQIILLLLFKQKILFRFYLEQGWAQFVLMITIIKSTNFRANRTSS
jgi:hypothetical protein